MIRLRDELRGENPAGELGVGSDRVGSGIPRDLGDLGGRIDEGSRNLSFGVDRRGALKPVREKELSVVFADGWIGAYISRLDQQNMIWRYCTFRGHFGRI